MQTEYTRKGFKKLLDFLNEEGLPALREKALEAALTHYMTATQRKARNFFRSTHRYTEGQVVALANQYVDSKHRNYREYQWMGKAYIAWGLYNHARRLRNEIEKYRWVESCARFTLDDDDSNLITLASHAHREACK